MKLKRYKLSYEIIPLTLPEVKRFRRVDTWDYISKYGRFPS